MTALPGKTVVVTGAAGGIGRRMALKAAQQGATVVAWDIDGGRLDVLVKEIDDVAPGRGHSYVVDVTDADLVTETARKVESEVGPVDVLILNAGVINGKLIDELTDAEIRKTFDVNVLGLYWATRAFLPSMKQRRSGHIVTIASAAGLCGVVRQVDYSATKHAAVGFAESLRVELHRYAPDLKTTLVCPYYINTGMFDGVKSKVGWLLPILEEQDVANKVISAVERDKYELFMPWSVATLPFLRGLPVRLFDRAMDILGVHASMDEFHGRAQAEKKATR
ncbi:MAG TPA: SDR family oxidoreductase [Frankiaceae bacterium]|nr:SDR family oxidoreductase [Frankiaceae bacterium]